MADQLEVPPGLNFRFQLNKQLLASISMNNPSDKRVGFKIKTTAPKKYVVRPSSGVVEPRSSMAVQVIMQAQKEYPADFQNCKDKFMVQTTVMSSDEALDKETFNKDVRKEMREHRLKVVLEGPAAPPSPVPEANENDDENSRAAAAAATVAPLEGTAEYAGAGDVRRSTLNSLAAATTENSGLKAEVDKLRKERDDLRRQLDTVQFQSASAKQSAAKQTTVQAAPRAGGMISIIYIILVAILAFLAGHYIK
jgi:hypothetical protein